MKISKCFLIESVFLYDLMGDCEKFNETTLPEKEEFYSNLTMEYITNVDYIYGI